MLTFGRTSGILIPVPSDRDRLLKETQGFRKEIKKKFNLGLISNQEEYYLTNARQTQLLEKAASSLQIAIDAMKMSIPSDLIVEDLYDSWSCLKEILGEQAKEDLLDELFKRFCIGK